MTHKHNFQPPTICRGYAQTHKALPAENAPLSSSSVAPASHKASHALICESLESMTNARCEFSERRPPASSQRHLLEEPFHVRCLLREPLQRYATTGIEEAEAKMLVNKRKTVALHTIVAFISVRLKDGDRLAVSKSAEDSGGCATTGENVRLKSQKQKESCPQR